MDACKLEQESMCEGIEAGGGRMHKCLFEHFDKLSVSCKDHEFNTQVSLHAAVWATRLLNSHATDSSKPSYC